MSETTNIQFRFRIKKKFHTRSTRDSRTQHIEGNKQKRYIYSCIHKNINSKERFFHHFDWTLFLSLSQFFSKHFSRPLMYLRCENWAIVYFIQFHKSHIVFSFANSFTLSKEFFVFVSLVSFQFAIIVWDFILYISVFYSLFVHSTASFLFCFCSNRISKLKIAGVSFKERKKHARDHRLSNVYSEFFLDSKLFSIWKLDVF